MDINNELREQSRRDFFTSTSSGLGGLALASLLEAVSYTHLRAHETDS